MAYYETEHQPHLIEEYFRVASPMQEQMRKACEPVGSPLDTLRCRLDEIWPAGAQLQTLFGRKMFVGLSRMVEPDTTFLAHHDIFSELPSPDVVLKPETGDLLIFDARKVHAVASPQDDNRLAFSCFVGYRGDDQPLTFWS